MTLARIDRSGVNLHYERVGDGPPVIFQHGLGGDLAQVREVFPDTSQVRRLTVECRAQGESAPGPLSAFSISTFADDVAFVATEAGMSPAVVGGISMGAAIAVRLTVVEPQLVKALILARPAWLWTLEPPNLVPAAVAAELLGRLGPEAGRAAFVKTEAAARLAEESPDNLASVLGYFDRPDHKATAALVAAIAADGPGVSEAEAKRIRVPTLVIGTTADAIHPMDYARRLSEAISGAVFSEITAKSVDRRRYAAEFRAVVSDFLGRVLG